MDIFQIILICIVLYFTYNYFFKGQTEKFTDQDLNLARELVVLFNNSEPPSFTLYLQKLVDSKNTSDNLISKGVYNKFLKNSYLTINDILQEL
jgi:hypothetical protein